VLGRDMIHNITSEKIGIKNKNKIMTLSTSPIKNKIRGRVEFLINIRLETKCC
jgi:hypothetical protein